MEINNFNEIKQQTEENRAKLIEENFNKCVDYINKKIYNSIKQGEMYCSTPLGGYKRDDKKQCNIQ